MATQTGRPPWSTRIRFEPVAYHHLMLDGRWWPRSHDPAAELPAVVAAVSALHGPVTRLWLSAANWTRRPHDITVAGHPVALSYFADQPQTMITAVCADGTRVTLLIEPLPVSPAPGPGDTRQDDGGL